MCGIIGLVSEKEVSSTLLEGLKRLEYRGYDSSGIATISNEKIERVRSKGNLSFLEEKLLNRWLLSLIIFFKFCFPEMVICDLFSLNLFR